MALLPIITHKQIWLAMMNWIEQSIVLVKLSSTIPTEKVKHIGETIYAKPSFISSSGTMASWDWPILIAAASSSFCASSSPLIISPAPYSRGFKSTRKDWRSPSIFLMSALTLPMSFSASTTFHQTLHAYIAFGAHCHCKQSVCTGPQTTEVVSYSQDIPPWRASVWAPSWPYSALLALEVGPVAPQLRLSHFSWPACHGGSQVHWPEPCL